MAADKFPCYSGMNFVSDNAYVIEDSPSRLVCGEGIRSVEFIRSMDKSLLFIEAKTTIANPMNSPEPYRKEINSLCEKFIHSLNMLLAVKVGVIQDSLPVGFFESNEITLKFVLVVRNHKSEWCRSVKRSIEQGLPEYLKKIWKPQVYVINNDTAVAHNITIAS
jgi:hypothetical protein